MYVDLKTRYILHLSGDVKKKMAVTQPGNTPNYRNRPVGHQVGGPS